MTVKYLYSQSNEDLKNEFIHPGKHRLAQIQKQDKEIHELKPI